MAAVLLKMPIAAQTTCTVVLLTKSVMCIKKNVKISLETVALGHLRYQPQHLTAFLVKMDLVVQMIPPAVSLLTLHMLVVQRLRLFVAQIMNTAAHMVQHVTLCMQSVRVWMV
jgi:hypothetical protein